MRTKHFLLFFLIISTLLLSSCTFELIQETDPEIVSDLPGGASSNLAGISKETINEIPVDLGEIGVSIDMRTLAVFGYKPTKVSLVIQGALSTYSQEEIIVDEYTHVADFKLSKQDLDDEVLEAFSNGVPINITVLDDAGVAIENRDISRFIINSTARTIKITTEKPRILRPISFNAAVPYYAQVASDTEFKFLSLTPEGGDLFYCYEVDENGTSCFNDGSANGGNLDLYNRSVAAGGAFSFGEAQLYFEKTPNHSQDSSYYIKSKITQSYLYAKINTNSEEIYLSWNKKSRELYDLDLYDLDPTDEFAFEFVLEQTTNGTVKIRLLSYVDTNGSLSDNAGSQKYLSDTGNGLRFNDTSPNDIEFNIISTNISWSFTDLGTKYSQPILPPVKMDFAFAQTIINCSGATGDYEVGVETVRERSTDISFGESLNLVSSNTSSESATVKAEASGTVFGVGVKASVEGTISTERTSTIGSKKEGNVATNFKEQQTVSIRRNITVPPNSAVEVFDVIQTLENIQIAFVQRIIIRGVVEEINLSGPEIEAQLIANGFGGVVTEIGSDFLVVSVRGSIIVANYFEFNNSLNDVAGACN